MRNLTNTGIEVIVNNLSGGNAIEVLNNSINVDINKQPITSTTSSNDQYLLQDANGNLKKILYSDLIGSSGSGLTAGSALAITAGTINLDISKETAVSSSVDTDIYVLEQADGSIKKITRANLLAGFINTNWTLNSGVLYPLATATNVAIGATSLNGTEKLRINGNSEFDGKITINGSNVLEATALTGSYNFNIQNTNFTNNGTLNLMGVNSVGATNLLTITNDSTLPKMNFPSGIWTNGNATNITETELFYLDGVSSNIQTQLNSLSSSVSTNSTNISTNQNNISTNSGNISTNSTGITNIKNKYDFTGSVSNGKLLIGNSSNYSVGELLSSDNSVTITKSAGGIDLVVPSSSSLNAGVAIAINTGNIDLDINKPNAFTSPVSADLLVMYDTTNSLTKKITYQNFNAGLQAQITSNDNDITSLNSSVTSLNSSVSSLTTQQNTNTSAIAINTTAISNLVSTANSTNFGTTASSSITLGNNNQSLAINSASMNAISAGKHFFRSNLSTGLGFEVQGYNSGSPVYHSVLQVHNVSSGYPYLSFLTNSGFQTSQLASKSIVIDANGRLDVGNLPQSLTGGTGITLNSSAIDIDFSNLATATQMFSNNEFIIYSDSDTTYKNITFQNVLNSIDLSPAFNFGTASSFTVNIGNANNQILNLQGSSINLNGSGVITNRSTVANGVGFKLDGYNSADTAYHSVLQLDNTNVSGEKPNLKIMDVNGNVNTASKTLTTDANGKLLWSTPAQTLGGGIGISIDSTPDINIDFTTIATATQVFSNNEFIIYSDSDSLYKNITFQNVLNSIDLSPAFNFGTASSFPVNIGHANNQTLTLQGSLININGSNKIKNRSTVSTGTCFEVDGYNSADSIYYSSLKLDNSNVAGVRPTVDILGSSGFYGGVGQNLTIDANGKIDWITPSTTGTVLEQYNTTTDLLNSVQTSGKMALVKNPLKLWVYANLSTGLVWRSLSFDTATNLSLNTSTYQLNSGGSTSFNSGDVITASTTGDIVKITVKVNDDLNPTVVNSLTSSTQTALDGWDGSSVVSMANAFSLTDNADGTYTYEGQLKTKNETDTTAISYTITDINSSTILTFNYSIQNSNPFGFGTGSPAIGGYYAVYSVGAGQYFVQTSTNYNLGFVGGSQVYWYCNAGSFTTSSTPTNTSNNNPMIFHYTTRTYNSQNIAVFYATTYNGSPGSYTAYSNRHFAVGHNTANLAFVSAGNDEYYMYSGTYQMSYTSSYNKIGFASGQNTTYTNNDAKWKFYKVA